jgi:ABC-2 type transport system permease protein
MASARHEILVFLTAWRIPVVLGVVQPTVFLLIVLKAPTHVTTAYASRVAIGVLLTAFWSFTVWTGAGILERERVEGTLAASMISVRDPRLVLVGKSLGSNLISALVTATSVCVVLGALGQPVRFDHPGWLAVGLLVLLLSGTALGVGLASLFLLTRFGSQLSAALMYPIFLLAGLLTPLSALPVWLRWLSWGISLRWAMTFLASTVAGPPDLIALVMVCVLTTGYAAVGAYAFQRIATFVREKGTIELV